jgi:hypothetical protein
MGHATVAAAMKLHEMMLGVDIDEYSRDTVAPFIVLGRIDDR